MDIFFKIQTIFILAFRSNKQQYILLAPVRAFNCSRLLIYGLHPRTRGKTLKPRDITHWRSQGVGHSCIILSGYKRSSYRWNRMISEGTTPNVQCIERAIRIKSYQTVIKINRDNRPFSPAVIDQKNAELFTLMIKA